MNGLILDSIVNVRLKEKKIKFKFFTKNFLLEIFCESPPEPMNMDMDDVNETQFSIGYKIQLKCREGYMLYGGNSLIFCTSDGEWTKVMGRCSSKFKINLSRS